MRVEKNGVAVAALISTKDTTVAVSNRIMCSKGAAIFNRVSISEDGRTPGLGRQ